MVAQSRESAGQECLVAAAAGRACGLLLGFFFSGLEWVASCGRRWWVEQLVVWKPLERGQRRRQGFGGPWEQRCEALGASGQA